MKFEPAVSLTEQIARHIGEEIIRGRLKPRSRIQELRVAGELGVSRGSVREALLILEKRHLIQIIPRRGALVSAMEGREIGNFCDLFSHLQSLFFSKIADSTGRRRDVFEPAVAEMEAAAARSDVGKMLAARARFLEAGLPLLDNFYLSSVLGDLIPVGQRVAHLVAAHPNYDHRDTLRYHQALLAALDEGALERVRELVAAYHGREKRLAIGCIDGGDSPSHVGQRRSA